jgi:hemoglobin
MIIATSLEESSMAEHASTDQISLPTDYERIGGAPAVSAVVDRFYQRLLDDPDLAHFFTTVDLPRLKRHQVLLISQVLGGPAEYSGRELGEAHAGLHITGPDFKGVVTHLIDVLREVNVDSDIIFRVSVALAGTEKDVVDPQAN